MHFHKGRYFFLSDHPSWYWSSSQESVCWPILNTFFGVGLQIKKNSYINILLKVFFVGCSVMLRFSVTYTKTHRNNTLDLLQQKLPVYYLTFSHILSVYIIHRHYVKQEQYLKNSHKFIPINNTQSIQKPPVKLYNMTRFGSWSIQKIFPWFQLLFMVSNQITCICSIFWSLCDL